MMQVPLIIAEEVVHAAFPAATWIVSEVTANLDGSSTVELQSSTTDSNSPFPTLRGNDCELEEQGFIGFARDTV
ncbi:MAG: hypothetical protein DSM106950_41405 [Stigonema ocellatum SAG 48.90 = DSM 106950]|nr:hypothetical protein [Stigonema ocellatum SAG 48.90 = DSM 106950]